MLFFIQMRIYSGSTAAQRSHTPSTEMEQNQKPPYANALLPHRTILTPLQTLNRFFASLQTPAYFSSPNARPVLASPGAR